MGLTEFPDIAVIDSGINAHHSHVNGISGGISFRLDENGNPVKDSDFRDAIGHGTAIAGIIRGKVPEAHLYALKIFHEHLYAPASLLISALDFAIANDMKLIQLSLGTEREDCRSDLEKLCLEAYEKKIIIVAAARSSDDLIYPASFDTVIGVFKDDRCDENKIVYHPDKPIPFGACGFPRPIPGLKQEANFKGSSFAAAHITAAAAMLITLFPEADLLQIKNLLIWKSHLLQQK